MAQVSEIDRPHPIQFPDRSISAPKIASAIGRGTATFPWHQLQSASLAVQRVGQGPICRTVSSAASTLHAGTPRVEQVRPSDARKEAEPEALDNSRGHFRIASPTDPPHRRNSWRPPRHGRAGAIMGNVPPARPKFRPRTVQVQKPRPAPRHSVFEIRPMVNRSLAGGGLGERHSEREIGRRPRRNVRGSWKATQTVRPTERKSDPREHYRG